MNQCKEYNTRILPRLFFLAIFTVIVLSFSNSQSRSSEIGAGISEQHKLMLIGIIPVNLSQYNQYGTIIYNLFSKVFPHHEIINIHDRNIARHLFAIARTCTSIGSFQVLRSLFHLHYNKDDLPDLS